MEQVTPPVTQEQTLAHLKSLFQSGSASRQKSIGAFLWAYSIDRLPLSLDELEVHEVLQGGAIWRDIYGNHGRTQLEADQAFAATVIGQDRLRVLRAEMINPSLSEEKRRESYDRAKNISVELAKLYLDGDPDGMGFVNVMSTIKDTDTFSNEFPVAKHFDISSTFDVIPDIVDSLITAKDIKGTLKSVASLDLFPESVNGVSNEVSNEVLEIFQNPVDVVGIHSTGSIIAALLSLKLEEVSGNVYPFKIIVPGLKGILNMYFPEFENNCEVVWLVDDQANQTYIKAYKYLKKIVPNLLVGFSY